MGAHYKRFTTCGYSLQMPYYMWVLITNALTHIVGTHYKRLATWCGYSLQTPWHMLWIRITNALTCCGYSLQTSWHDGAHYRRHTTRWSSLHTPDRLLWVLITNALPHVVGTYYKCLTTYGYSLQTPHHMWVLITNAWPHIVGTSIEF